MTTPTTPEQPEPSATPRTDWAFKCAGVVNSGFLEHARQLERELASTRAANAELLRDKERLDWCLKYCFAATLGRGASDFYYLPIRSRDQIDTALSRATTQAGE